MYWDDKSYVGWYRGTVECISDGSAKLKSRLVPRGYAIVNYGKGNEGGKYVHLLDRTTHIQCSLQGKTRTRLRTGLWRLDTPASDLTESAWSGTKCISVSEAAGPYKRTAQAEGRQAKRRAVGSANPALVKQSEVWCDPCGIHALECAMLCCSNCRKSHRCIGCLRINAASKAGEWKCDECRAKSIDPSPTWDPEDLLPYNKCLFCQTPCQKQKSSVAADEMATDPDLTEEAPDITAEQIPSNHVVCSRCGMCVCHDCGCTLEGDEGKSAPVCWVCSGIKDFEEQNSQRIREFRGQLGASVDMKSQAAAKKADRFALLVYQLRMSGAFGLVKSVSSRLAAVLRKQANLCGTTCKVLPSLTPSQFNNMISFNTDYDCDLLKRISLAYSAAANMDAKKLLQKTAGTLTPLEPIPAAHVRMRLGLLIGDATRHPLIDLYSGTIEELLEDQTVMVVLLLAGDVDTSYDPVRTLVAKASSKGKVVLMGQVTAESQVEVFLKAREQRLHGCLDLIGSAAGERWLRPMINAGLSLMQCHHLNFPNPQYPVDGMGNTHMITDPVMFAPHSEQTRIGGHEGMATISCWMPPLRPNVVDASLSRESFGLDPNNLYLVFVALNSKLDPVSVELFVGALNRTSSDVYIWILSYPALGAIHFIDNMKRHASWKDEFEHRVVRGQHLPKELHLARLVAFGTGGRGAIFLNFGLTYPAHTSMQEAICAGIVAMLLLLQAAAACVQLAAASLMNCVGLGDLVANGINHALTLVEFWSHRDQDVRRMQISHDLRTEYLAQKGFWDQKRVPAEIVNVFRQIAANSCKHSRNCDKTSSKHVDARLPEKFPLPTTRFPDSSDDRAAWKPLIPLAPQSMLDSLMVMIRNCKKFDDEQMPMVFDILCLSLRNQRLPTKVIGVGGFCIALECIAWGRKEPDVLKIEYHRVFMLGKDFNSYNSELMRAVNAEAHFKKRIGRLRCVKTADIPGSLSAGDFAHVLGFTKPRGEQGEVVVFNCRALLKNQFGDLMRAEFVKFKQTGELGDQVRILQQLLQNALGRVNADGKISIMDVSPTNFFLDDDNTIVFSDMGGAAVHQVAGQTSRASTQLMRRNTTAANPMRHIKAAVPPKRKDTKGRGLGHGLQGKVLATMRAQRIAAKAQSDPMAPEPIDPSKQDSGFTFWSSEQVRRVFQRRAEKGGDLKRIRPGTKPFRDITVKDLTLTAGLGEHIDRFAGVRVLLYFLAPRKQKESWEAWDREAREAAVSTDAMDRFIADRMPGSLRADHPKQPLMWGRLLSFLVNGLVPWPAAENQGVTSLGLTTSLFLSTPFLDPVDDRALAGGGSIRAPGGPLYGANIPTKLSGKTIKQTELRFIRGKGVGLFADEDMMEGDVASIYVCSCVPRNDQGIDSRYAISYLGAEPTESEPLIYVARFTSKMSVRWYIDVKKSAGPFMNAPGNGPGSGEKANCKLERLLAWDDDRDMDLGRALKIFPILVDAHRINKGEQLTWMYDPNAGQGGNFPIN